MTSWDMLMEQFYDWFEEDRAVGMALCMVRRLATDRGDSHYDTWAENVLTSMGRGIPASLGRELDTTPSDFFRWATRVEALLWAGFEREGDSGRAQDTPEGDASSLRDNRYRHGRRRIRDSRTPRRSSRPSTGEEATRVGRTGRARSRPKGTGATGSGAHSGKSEYVDVRLDEAPGL